MFAQYANKHTAGDRRERAYADILSPGRRRNQRHADGKNHEFGRAVENADDISGENGVARVVDRDRQREESLKNILAKNLIKGPTKAN